jgi:hypothetical protein
MGMADSNDPRYKWYLEQRQEYARLAIEHLSRFERTVLLASAGGLAAVFSIAGASSKDINSFAIAASISLAVSFGTMILGHYFSYLDNEKAIQDMDLAMESQSNVELTKLWFGRIIEPLNVCSLFSLAIGYLMLGVWLMSRKG